MRFEVNVDDGNNLNSLHKARDAWNAAHQDAQAPDMSSFVQVIMDQAVASALNALPQPTTLSEALAKIAALEAEKENLTKDVAALTPIPVEPAKPA